MHEGAIAPCRQRDTEYEADSLLRILESHDRAPGETGTIHVARAARYVRNSAGRRAREDGNANPLRFHSRESAMAASRAGSFLSVRAAQLAGLPARGAVAAGLQRPALLVQTRLRARMPLVSARTGG